MARGINKVILVGNLGADPETRYSAAGAPVVSIRVATTEGWRDRQSGEMQERTEWHRVKFFGRLAEIAAEYLRKGSQVYIEGSLRTDKYTAQDGSDRYFTEVIAREMQMLGSRGGDRGGGWDSDRGGGRGQAQRGSDGGGFETRGGAGYTGSRSGGSGPAPSRPAPASPEPAAESGAFQDDFDDDNIPF